MTRLNTLGYGRPHPCNASGDFYVEDGCCTSCNMPFTVAADLFTSADDGHCYVSKQPTTDAESDRMLQAFQVQDVGCIRYKGTSRVIQIKLVAAGEAEQCDHLDNDLAAPSKEVAADKWGLQGNTVKRRVWWRFWQ
jgi:hypothetical protein